MSLPFSFLRLEAQKTPPLFFLSLLVILFFLVSPEVGAQGQSFKDDMAERTRACTACHGEQGRAGPDGYYPRLAGKPAGYLFNQLKNFQEGRRHYKLMTRLVDPLSDAYLKKWPITLPSSICLMRLRCNPRSASLIASCNTAKNWP